MTMSRKTSLFSALAVCVMALPAVAVPVFQPDSAASDQGSANGTLIVENLIMQANGVGDVVTDSTDMLDGTNGGGDNNNWAYSSAFTATTYPGTLTFDFNSAVSMDTFYLWNMSHPNPGNANVADFGMKDFELKLYDGAGGSGTLLNTVSGLTAAIAPLLQAPIPSQAFDLGGLWAGVQSVELIVANNQGGDSNLPTFTFFGAREVAFSVVPEPASATLLLGGVFGLLSAFRRRR